MLCPKGEVLRSAASSIGLRRTTAADAKEVLKRQEEASMLRKPTPVKACLGWKPAELVPLVILEACSSETSKGRLDLTIFALQYRVSHSK